MLTQRQGYKFIISILLLVIGFVSVSNTELHLNNSPYFFSRLAKLEYVLNTAGSASTLQSWWSPYGIDIVGIPAAGPAISVGLSFLAICSKILGVPLSKLAFYPLIPLLAPPAVYLLARRVLDHELAVIPATLSTIYVSAFYSFHEYVFGRFVLFPLFVATAILAIRTQQKRHIALSLIALVGLKFTAPGTEPVAVVSIIVFATLHDMKYKNEFLSSNFVILYLIIFFIINPKLYIGAIGGLFTGGGPVTLEPSGELIAQFSNALEQLTSMVGGSSSPSHPLDYNNGGQANLAGQARTTVIILMGLFTGFFGLHEVVNGIRRRRISLVFIVISSLLAGVVINVGIRAVLLGRFGPKGLLVILPFCAIVALSRYLTAQRVQIVGIALILVLGAATVTTHGPVTQTFSFDQSEHAAEWQSENIKVPQPALSDFQTRGNLAYHHAEQGTYQHWAEYNFIDYNASLYSSLIEGKGTQAKYIFFDQDTRYPLKPQSYGTLEPLDPHYDKIDYENQLNEVYVNGNTAIKVS